MVDQKAVVRCAPREAFQRACIKRAEFYESEARLFRAIAAAFAGADIDGAIVTRLWDGISESTPGMERPPK